MLPEDRRTGHERYLEALKDLVRSEVGAWGIVHPDLRPQPATVRALVQLFAEALPPLFALAA